MHRECIFPEDICNFIVLFNENNLNDYHIGATFYYAHVHTRQLFSIEQKHDYRERVGVEGTCVFRIKSFLFLRGLKSAF